MVAISNTTSITLVRDELGQTLAVIEAALEAFAEDRSRTDDLARAHEAVAQVHGIARMLELPAAVVLLDDMRQALQRPPAQLTDADLAALGRAALLLERYLEYVQLTDRPLPPLLVPGINELRAALGQPLLAESFFFELPGTLLRQPEPEPAQAAVEELPRLARRLRHMYQAGLLAVLRHQGGSGLKLMARAMAGMDRLCGPAPLGSLWWLAQGVLQGLSMDRMLITASRRQLLSQYDRQLKAVIYQGAEALASPPPPALVQESLYLLAIASVRSGVAGEIAAATALPMLTTEAELQQEMTRMSGASASVTRSVAAGLKEELGMLQQHLDMVSQGALDTRCADLGEMFGRLAGTLEMVTLTTDAEHLRGRASQLQAESEQMLTPEHAQYPLLMDDVLCVENAIAALERRVAPRDDINRDIRNDKISMYQLDDARRTVVGECRAGLSLTKRSLTTYLESQGDTMHLVNVPSVLTGVSGGLMFLELQRAQQVLERCRGYIQEQLLAPEATVPPHSAMETLADAVTSVDYYLESMEEQKPIGEAVLDVAAASMAELGYAVPSAEPA